ncbi:hypothetical protein LCGC14_0873450 [marine sediment metagenome]|uniref:Uncharacterized protein n=1 Tax=marine sediment metagenome TaxID=412755 RepID=A0A0F9PPQ7_9ZZZZ
MDLNSLLPKKLNFGAGDLVEMRYLEKVFGIHRRTASKYLSVLHLEPLYIGKEVYFSLTTFKRIMYILTKPGQPGFLFPGSAGKASRKRKNKGDFITEVTDDILEQAAQPSVLAEMCAAEGRDISVLKKFITPAPGRPRKEDTK